VQYVVLHGVELSFLEDSKALLAINIKLHCVDIGRIEELAELGLGDSERESLGKTLLVLEFTIEIAGDNALLTQLLGSLLAAGDTCCAFDFDCFHFLLVFVLL
jgi:hypothetical protein